MFTRDVSKVEILLNTDCPLALPININTSTATHRWWSCTVLYCTGGGPVPPQQLHGEQSPPQQGGAAQQPAVGPHGQCPGVTS